MSKPLKVFLGGLPSDASVDDIHLALSKFGTISVSRCIGGRLEPTSVNHCRRGGRLGPNSVNHCRRGGRHQCESLYEGG